MPRPRNRSSRRRLSASSCVDETDRVADRLGAAGAADAVHVILRLRRKVEVDDVRNAVDVDAAGGDVGRDQHAHVAGSESLQRRQALALRAIRMQRRRRQAGGARACARCDRRRAWCARRPAPIQARHPSADESAPAPCRAGETSTTYCVTASAGVERAPISTSAGDFRTSFATPSISFDIVAEKSSVCRVAGVAATMLPDRGQEAHVEHPVGFVEHQHLQRREIDVALLHQIDQAAGRGDHEIDAALERLDLRALADAAEDRRVAQTAGAGRRRGRSLRSARPARASAR